MKTIPFELPGFKTSRGYKAKKHNNDLFVFWVKETLQELVKTENLTREDNQRYNAMALYLNKANCDLINTFVDPLLFLMYCPKTDNSLTDQELGYEPKELLTKEW